MATKLTPELISEIKQNKEKFMELYDAGILRYSPVSGSVQISADVFDANIKEFSLGQRDCETYPYMKRACMDGLQFIALYKEV